MIRTDVIAPVPELLKRHAAQRPDKTAFEDADGAITYGRLEQSTANVAGHLADLGIEPGERLAIYLPNSVAWVQVCLAALRAGAVCVPISYDASESEVLYRLQDAQCRAIVTTAERRDLIASMGKDARDLAMTMVTGLAGDEDGAVAFDRLIDAAPKSGPRDPDDIDGVSYIVYTSGTTGKAKGVRLSTRGMLWVTAACWMPIAGLGDEDFVLSPLPLFHSYALNLSVLSIVATGASEFILERYSTDAVMERLAEGRFTVLPGVPTMFHYLLEAAAEKGFKPSGLRLCISAGAIMPAALNEQFENHFGVKLLDGYGITETCTMVTMNWPDGGRVMGSCGIPVPGLATRIIDPATGSDVAFGEEGELIVRGPNLMLGYHDKPKETAAALRNGWYHTGDLARSDASGYLTITGRLKELIIRGGQNIAPAEIEEAVSGFEGVLDCAVAGAPHEHLGEVPVVFIVEREGQSVDQDALVSHCRAQLSSYKVPAAIHVVEAIPRTGSGKVMRFKLVEQLG